MKIERKMPTPEQFEAIYRSVGWDAPGLEQIRVALNHSLQGFMIFDDGKPIGMARLLGDYAMAYLIKDVAVLPEYQHRGAGTLLMQEMLKYIKEQLPVGWAVGVELTSSPQGEAFYRKFGFQICPNDVDGHGMFMMLAVE